jgi:hypothetical protein
MKLMQMRGGVVCGSVVFGVSIDPPLKSMVPCSREQLLKYRLRDMSATA